ncbi:MAG: Rid family detoxifying hydrolase [Candidatus Liptonbacteria bacterium]|nr:Rid family detoxifying hydrolase [Candidatus Liptonbacteria bacterium]
MKTKVSTIKAPQATGPFSQAVVVGDLIFTSGQICLTLEGKLLEGSIEEQIHQIMKNLQAILEEAGVSFVHVVKTTIYVTDMAIYKTVNEIYGSYMAEPFPAREVVCVKELPLGAQIEISMVAEKSS